MSGLRVYIKAAVTHADGSLSTFYSRKGGGPFYQWLYDPKLEVWRCSRLDSTVLTSRAFYIAAWKSLPSSLKNRLKEHYIE